MYGVMPVFHRDRFSLRHHHHFITSSSSKCSIPNHLHIEVAVNCQNVWPYAGLSSGSIFITSSSSSSGSIFITSSSSSLMMMTSSPGLTKALLSSLGVTCARRFKCLCRCVSVWCRNSQLSPYEQYPRWKNLQFSIGGSSRLFLAMLEMLWLDICKYQHLVP